MLVDKKCQIRLRTNLCQSLQGNKINWWSTQTMENSKWSHSKQMLASREIKGNIYRNWVVQLKVWRILNNSCLNTIKPSNRIFIPRNFNTNNSTCFNKVLVPTAKEMIQALSSKYHLTKCLDKKQHQLVSHNYIQHLNPILKSWEDQVQLAMGFNQLKH
jgi:hypothetical protein